MKVFRTFVLFTAILLCNGIMAQEITTVIENDQKTSQPKLALSRLKNNSQIAQTSDSAKVTAETLNLTEGKAKISPNPAEKFIEVEYKSVTDGAVFYLTDEYGEYTDRWVVFDLKGQHYKVKKTVTHLEPGNYHLEVEEIGQPVRKFKFKKVGERTTYHKP